MDYRYGPMQLILKKPLMRRQTQERECSLPI